MRNAGARTTFLCKDCGYSSPKWNGRCPACGAWGTITEFTEPKRPAARRTNAGGAALSPASAPTALIEQPSSDGERTSTGLTEVDRLLGGGIVAGSVVLLAGDPGIGKSTLLLQAAGSIAEAEGPILYVSGEESGAQVRLRAERLGVRSPAVRFSPETDAPAIGALLMSERPSLLFVDSIQTLTSPDAPSSAGSVAQVRECAQLLIGWAKQTNTPIVMTGHVTKDGNIAGPRVLEHMVDVVLALEGEPVSSLRLLRCSKNRFGATNGVALLEMRNEGLIEVTDPSALLVGERDPSAPGSAVAVTMQGNRPLLCEVQALTNPSVFSPPRRTATGVDFNRMAMLAAVLSRRSGISIGNQDVMVNIPSGLHVDEPALDLAVATAIASSFLDAPVHPGTVLMGEVGLNSEVRSVAHLERRLDEAARHGFGRALIPKAALRSLTGLSGIQVIGVSGIREAIAAAIPTR
ncbi:MAG: DNA repair protein RadA [Chloroflexota bacterium]|nr:DNA repair protein RadA [Chloroflexota bacterium]MDE2885499.1 DNA repair protein RadA [Chloroflexota bacterium]